MAGQFSTQLFSLLNTDRPSWFPAPHRVFECSWERVSSVFLQPSTDTIRTFAPTFEILLNGDEDTLAIRCLTYIYIHAALLSRHNVALQDPGVCPLPKHEWRQVTLAILMEAAWPEDAPEPFHFAYMSRYGHPSIWGQELTAEAVGMVKKGLSSPIRPPLLDCGHLPINVDWEKDNILKISLLLQMAEEQLYGQLALLDLDLHVLTHADAVPLSLSSHKHFDSYPLAPTDDHDPCVALKVSLVKNIVWFGKESEWRGWEREDLHERRD